ncbi:MAG: FAD-dependent oxidoreductase [Pirellulales bacterium]
MIRVRPTEKYDAIIIGSGIGGLTVASLLAQLGKKRVLVLEQHFKLGGYTHSFRRGDFEWDVGLHYVGEMHANKLSRRVMDLVTRKEVLWHRCGPIVERYYFPEGQFQVPDDPGLFQDKLIEAFPQERKALIRYFRDVRKCQGWIARFFFSKIMPPILANLLTFPGRKLAETLTNDYLNRFESPWLKGILAGQWPDFGTIPTESAFAYHSAVAGDFFHGSFYPIGGAQEISKSVEKTVVEAGGACLVNHSVTEVIIENGKAVGVRAKNKNKEVEFSRRLWFPMPVH